MLVLSRKVGERLVINGDIIVEVLETDRGKVRLGITAPREVPIMREELTEDERTKLAPPPGGAQ